MTSWPDRKDNRIWITNQMQKTKLQYFHLCIFNSLWLWIYIFMPSFDAFPHQVAFLQWNSKNKQYKNWKTKHSNLAIYTLTNPHHTVTQTCISQNKDKFSTNLYKFSQWSVHTSNGHLPVLGALLSSKSFKFSGGKPLFIDRNTLLPWNIKENWGRINYCDGQSRYDHIF